jgi:hypothetical protein
LSLSPLATAPHGFRGRVAAVSRSDRRGPGETAGYLAAECAVSRDSVHTTDDSQCAWERRDEATKGETLRKLRVCVYEGTALKGMPKAFVSALAYAILSELDAVVVTGGFVHSLDKPDATSTDIAALDGARYSIERGVDLATCYEAWIPDPALGLGADFGRHRTAQQ